MKTRAGTFIAQPSGYRSFTPNPLPPVPPVAMDADTQKLLSLADRKLGRLDGITFVLPNPELFVAMYVKKEALLSSQIEGTQASFIDILAEKENKQSNTPVLEVVDYVKAMNFGLQRLRELPLSLRLLKEIHAILLEHGRGYNKNPGEFRASQNWIGPTGCDLNNAVFVPPTVPEMMTAMGDLEVFMHADDSIPALLKIALIHSQFETIHPFLDGNGRMGRLLITFWLCQQEILAQPLLYLSYYFKQNRLEYYDRLMAVRTKGDFEGWIKFFLNGIAVVADEATAAAKDIINLRTNYSALLSHNFSSNHNYQRLLDNLFDNPIITKKEVAELLKVSYPTASNIVEVFESFSILQKSDPLQKRNKIYKFNDYLDILQKGTELPEA